MALPPGALDDVIGNHPKTAEAIRDAIAKSSQFLDIIKNAVANAKVPTSPGATYGQQVREGIINQMRGQSADALPD